LRLRCSNDQRPQAGSLVENQTAAGRKHRRPQSHHAGHPCRCSSLINGYAARGIMLPRTEFEMSENMRDFMVAYDGQQLVGLRGHAFLLADDGRSAVPRGGGKP
jgi:hypothetical protein